MITGRFTEPSAAGQGFHKIVEEDSDWITIDKIYDVYVHKESKSWKKKQTQSQIYTIFSFSKIANVEIGLDMDRMDIKTIMVSYQSSYQVLTLCFVSD